MIFAVRAAAVLGLVALLSGVYGRPAPSRFASDASSVQPLHRSFVLEHSLDSGHVRPARARARSLLTPGWSWCRLTRCAAGSRCTRRAYPKT